MRTDINNGSTYRVGLGQRSVDFMTDSCAELKQHLATGLPFTLDLLPDTTLKCDGKLLCIHLPVNYTVFTLANDILVERTALYTQIDAVMARLAAYPAN